MSLKSIARETIAILDQGHYTAPSGELRSIATLQADAEARTVLYRPEQLPKLLRQAGASGGPPHIEVWEGTTQACAAELLSEGAERLVLLNYASARNPGGGFINGAQAQEEDLARSSGLYRCLLRQPRYYEANKRQSSALYTDHIIYSPDVPFFRTDTRGLLEEPFLASVITAPAPNAGQFRRKRRGRGSSLEKTLRHRAGGVLAVAREHGHRVLLLGAWGCGVFRNEPALVADAFGVWLEGPEFAGDFDRVVFGVYDPRRPQANLRAFEQRFMEDDA